MAKIEAKYIGPEELKTLNRVSKDPFFFSSFCYVINPVLGRVQFNLYPFQKAVLLNFLKNRFNIILKFRQAGITELISMFCLWLTMFHPNKKVNIISIKDTTAKKVLKKIKFMYKNLPWYLQTPIINGRAGEFGSASMIEFSNGSFIESIPTSEQAGRSESLSLLVIDEAAIVKWASVIWASSFPTLSCISGDYPILLTNNPNRENLEGNKKGLQLYTIPIKELAPKTPGIIDLRDRGVYTLSHTGRWKQVLDAVNKGKLLTWEIEDCRGNRLDCTPKHRLLTTNGWETVENIVKYNLSVIQVDMGYNSKKDNPELKPKDTEVEFRPLFRFGSFNYQITNFGDIYKIDKAGELVKVKVRIHKGFRVLTLCSRKEGGTKNWKVSRLVYEAFRGPIPEGMIIDHVDNNPLKDHLSNLQCISNSQNVKKAYSTNTAYMSLISGYPIQMHSKVLEAVELNPNKSDHDISLLLAKSGLKVSRKTVCNIRRKSKVYLSKLSVIREYVTDIYDIHVAEDHSYILPTCNFINHNTGGSAILNSTPYGSGNFFHNMWVDALSGGNPFNPIRLHWQMHPDRDQAWYDQMKAALGPRRTAQEIDGDFLSSGNTVFDMADIRDIEESLVDYPPIKTAFNSQYMEFDEVDPHKEYFIGADVATGRSLDYSSFTVMDKEGEEAAVYKGRIPISRYGKLLGDTGIHFNEAVIAPESNDIGIAVTMYLQTEGYPKLYHSTKLLKKKHKNKPEEEKVPGWLTTSKNRSVIINGLEEDIRKGNVIIKDPFFVNEAPTFIYDAGGIPMAKGKRNRSAVEDIDMENQTYTDDDIMGKAITNHIRKSNGNNIIILPQ